MSRILLIAGVPASGKTTYGRHISKKLGLPFISKDSVKERLFDVIQYDVNISGMQKKIGRAAYAVTFGFVEDLMAERVRMVLESNFTGESVAVISKLLKEYEYSAMTVMLDARTEILYNRFCSREYTTERHPGLRTPELIESGYVEFAEGCKKFREFSIGDKTILDTSDFDATDYCLIDREAEKFMQTG